MLDKLFDSIFDFASTPRGLLSILAGAASAKDRRRDTPAYGGGVSYGMPGPRRLEAVKGLGRYADVMGFSNGGQTVDIRQPLRYGLAQGPYGQLLAYDIPDMTPAPAPAPAPEEPKQTKPTESKIDDYGYEYTPPTGPVGTYNQQINDFLTDMVAGAKTLGTPGLTARGLSDAGQYILGSVLNARPGAIRADDSPDLADVESREAQMQAQAHANAVSKAAQEVYDYYYGGGGGGGGDGDGGGSGGGGGGGGGGDGGLGAGTEGYDAGDMAHATGGAVRSYAQGGSVRPFPMQDGGFVMTKRAVDGAGGPRGIAQLLPNARMIRGPGTGTSDSIPATIQGRNGVTPAKVSNGESYVPPKGVEEAGGAQALYNLMNNLQRRA